MVSCGTKGAAVEKWPGADRCGSLTATGLREGADSASVYSCIGRLGEDGGNKAAARAQYALALKDDPDNAWAKTRLAQLK